jgi:hypothetical protein
MAEPGTCFLNKSHFSRISYEIYDVSVALSATGWVSSAAILPERRAGKSGGGCRNLGFLKNGWFPA